MLIFHRNRRDLLAKAFLDIFKLTLVASCVSGFFPNFDVSIRLIIIVLIGLTGIAGILVCPPEKEN